MKRSDRVPKLRKRHAKEIKYKSDFQIDWTRYIPELRNYDLQSVDLLSISGDAPKDFVTVSEYRRGYRRSRGSRDRYIAKVGSKFYPLESVIEQLITYIGKCFDLKIADSRLRTIDGQVRFLSKYFLKNGEQLTHGAEIYEYSIGRENYRSLSENKQEAKYFSFQMTVEAIKELFPVNVDEIIGQYVEMLTFDAVIGHNDRHPYNWGVVVPISKGKSARFSPVFDTARALFWNIPERRVDDMLSNNQAFESYVKKCQPPIGWDSQQNVAFFDLIALIWKQYPGFRENIEKFLNADKLGVIEEIIDTEFGSLLSANRRELIKRCLHQRQTRLRNGIRDLDD